MEGWKVCRNSNAASQQKRNDSLQDEKDRGSDDGSDDTDEGEEGGQYVKVAMTPEEVALAKEATRNMRKANKKAVKEANSEKRKVKIKKKDKKRDETPEERRFEFRKLGTADTLRAGDLVQPYTTDTVSRRH